MTVALAISISPRRASGNDFTYQVADDDESSFPGNLIFWHSLNKVDEPLVSFVPLPQHLIKRQVPLLLCHLGVEGIDATVRERNTSVAFHPRG